MRHDQDGIVKQIRSGETLINMIGDRSRERGGDRKDSFSNYLYAVHKRQSFG
jgi:hypothetical protein